MRKPLAVTCPDDCDATCGNAVCDTGEDNTTCVLDCAPRCGNAVCEQGENDNNCAPDCDPECPNGICEMGENATNCAQDCTATCGNGICEVIETTADCASDCPASVTTMSTPGASTDDAEEGVATGDVYLDSSDLELTEDGVEQVVGIRFSLDVVPRNTIVSAYVQFTTDETTTDATSLTISAEAADDPAAFTSTNGDVSRRPTVASSVDWSPPAWTIVGEAGPDQRTPGMTAVIQDVVDRPGWMAGNHVVVLIRGAGNRVAESHDGDLAGAPVLVVEHSGPTDCGDGTCGPRENNNNCPSDCTVVCPNAVCEAGENATNCAADCPAMCGNAVCEPAEDPATCAVDCPLVCGDNVCDAGEDCSSCAQD